MQVFPASKNNCSRIVELFIQTGLELVEHIHGRTDKDFSKLFVVCEHGIPIQQPSFVLKHPCPSVQSVVTSLKNTKYLPSVGTLEGGVRSILSIRGPTAYTLIP